MMDAMTAIKPIGQRALLLLNGWGYNLYREQNRLRADDLLIRSKATEILAQARRHLGTLESAYRRTHLVAPTRERPLPTAADLEQARMIARCGALIEPVSVAIHSAAAPTNDEVWRRHRSERDILEILQRIDVKLIDAVVEFHDFVVELDLMAISSPDLEIGIQAQLRPIKLAVQERAERLTILV